MKVHYTYYTLNMRGQGLCGQTNSPMMKIGKKTPLGMGRETAIATKMYCGKKKNENLKSHIYIKDDFALEFAYPNNDE